MIFELCCAVVSIVSFTSIFNSTKQSNSTKQNVKLSQEEVLKILKAKRVEKSLERFKQFINSIDDSFDDTTFRESYIEFLKEEGFTILSKRIEQGYYNDLAEKQIELKRMAIELDQYECFKANNSTTKKEIKRFKNEANLEKEQAKQV